MLTRNTSSAAAYVFGVPIAAIQRCLEAFSTEMHSDSNRVYCPACGGVSRAAAQDGYYCDLCGAVMPQAADIPHLLIPQVAALYRENAAPCLHCQGQTGSYQGRCLRCGQHIGRSGLMTSPV
jgi:tRNA(Ile2) C34 agmatinyltransferase TiaS